MALPRSPTPSRLPAGSSTDPPYGPMADSGYTNPFFYHQFADDFDNALAATGLYTITATGGSIAHTPGDGGLALFTTGAVSTNFAELQLPAASFTLPQGAQAGKKLFWLARFQVSDIVGTSLILGLCNTNTTPFSTGITDGVYFSKAAAGTVWNIISEISNTTTTTAIPPGTYSTWTNNTNIDLGFYIDAYGNLNAFVSPNMVGYIPQSGTGPSTPTRGRCLQVSGLNLSTANLTPTLAVATGAAASKTMTVDFHCAQKER